MRSLKNHYIIVSIIICLIFIGCGLIFINYDFDSFIIHKLPKLNPSRTLHNECDTIIEANRLSFERVEHDIDHYDSLLNLYQTRISMSDWIITCLGILVTFLAFYIQYDFNNKQKEEINRQKEDLAQERYENKLFHMLDVYRDICNNSSINNAGVGKVAYHYMFYEYKAIFFLIKTENDILDQIQTKNDDNEVDIETINYIAFTYFINGVTTNKIETSFRENIISDVGKGLIRDKLLEIQENSINNKEHKETNYLSDYKNQQIKFFDGHRPRFIPYIKYIHLILEFIIQKSNNKVYDSIKYLINEQTDHEIGLIYAYNGYKKYMGENINSDTEPLWDRMYNNIPEHMKYKFKYNDERFLL